MMRILSGGVSAFALVMTAAAANPPEQAGETPRYESAGADKSDISAIDVKTREDAIKLADRQFKAADANADGAVDLREFEAFLETNAKRPGAAPMSENAEPADKAFAEIAKGDSAISKEDLVEARSKSFEKADANGDRSLDPLEQQRFATLVAARPADTVAQ